MTGKCLPRQRRGSRAAGAVTREKFGFWAESGIAVLAGGERQECGWPDIRCRGRRAGLRERRLVGAILSVLDAGEADEYDPRVGGPERGAHELGGVD
jgi:hypothetical protein